MSGRPLVFLGLVSLAASGCVVVSTPKDSSAAPSTPVAMAAASKETSLYADSFPETLGILERAEQELAAGRADAAVRVAEQARAKYFEEKKALKSPGEGRNYDHEIAERNREATRGVTLRRVGVTVTAEWSQGHELRALAALHDHAFHPGFCSRSIKGTCDEVWRAMRERYPHVWAPRRTELELFPRAGIDRFLATSDMEAMDGFLEEGSGQYVVYVFPMESSKAKDGRTEVAVRGAPGSVMVEQCSKVGKLRIQDVDFDVSRCGDVRENLTPASVRLRVSSEDAALVASRKKGEAIALLIDSASVKRRGNTWDLGETRAFWVGELKAPSISGDRGD